MGKPSEPDREAETQTLGVAPTVGAEDAPTVTATAPARVRPPVAAQIGEPAAPLQRGDRLEQFLILDRLGSGGMGVVVAAHDPDLDRKVAIKVLRSDVIEGGSDAAGRIRLLREAQAMAKLQHPNVITVHEVGVVDGQVFVAMEYVDGPTLGKWRREEKPGWRDIVAKYIDAARGLAAAHAAGLVHRDFKPANVLVGSDGRVRVTDFGLVGSTSGGDVPASEESASDAPSASSLVESDASSPPPSSPPSTPPSTGALGVALTTAGQVMGTPVYMAPEQHLAQSVDARADQFAFCVSLYEALYGKRPFSTGKSREDLAANVCRGKIREPPKDSDVPTWVRRVLVRGLSVDPDDRFPSIAALIEALEKDPAVARRRAGMLAGIAILAGVAIFGLVRGFGSDRPAPCKGAAEKLAGVWDDNVKKATLVAFSGTELPHAADSFDRAGRTLDEYSEAWVAMRTEACEATRVHGEQSETLLDARMHCLDRRLGEVRALTSLFARGPDKEVVNSSVRATLELTALDGCADGKALLAAVPPPDDPTVRKMVDALRARLDEADANLKAGKYADGIAIASAVRDEAVPIDYKPLVAETLFILGSLQSQGNERDAAEVSLRAAAEAAAEAGDDRHVAEAWSLLVFVVGYLHARHEEGVQIANLALTAVKRAGGDADLVGSLLSRRAVVLKAKGEYAPARELYERALVELERAHGSEHPVVANCLNNLGNLLSQMGELEAAEERFRRAMDIRAKALGTSHPDVADSLIGLASLMSQSKPTEAEEYGKRALAIREKSLPPGHPRLASALNILGGVFLSQGKFETARQHFERSHAIWASALGADHPNVAHPLSSLGHCLMELGRLDEAQTQYERALAIREKSLGSDHPDVANSLRELASLAHERKRWEVAESLCQRALAIDEKSFGSDHLLVAYDLLCVGEALVSRGSARRAAPSLERALALGQAVAMDPVALAYVRFALARALWGIGRDRGRAVDLAKKARTGVADAGSEGKDLLGEVDAWLPGKRAE